MDIALGFIIGVICGALTASGLVLACYRAVQVKRDDSLRGAHLKRFKPIILEGEDPTEKFIAENFDVERV